MFFRKDSSDRTILDAGARARMQAQAARVVAGVYRFWDQGVTVDVSYADGRVELDNTLYGIANHSILRDGSKYLKKFENLRPYTGWRAVVGGDTHLRLVLQPSPNWMIRTFNDGQPTDWIGSIVVVPKSKKRLTGLIRLRSDLPSDRNAKLLQRVKRLFVQHSEGVEARDMTDAEASEHSAVLPAPAITKEEPKSRWAEVSARQDRKRQLDEARYQELVKASASNQPMPFQTWVSHQAAEALWTYTAHQLAAFLDDAYGGPGVVDAFYVEGLKHALHADIFSVKSRPSYSQLSDMENLAFERADLRRQILTARSRDADTTPRKTLGTKLREMAQVAENLGLLDLEQEYRDEAYLL